MSDWETVFKIRLGKALRLMRGHRKQVDIARRGRELDFFLDNNEISRYERSRGLPTLTKLSALLATLSDDGKPDFCDLQRRMNEVEQGGDELFDPEIALFEGEAGDPEAQAMFDEIFAEQFAEMRSNTDSRVADLEQQVKELAELVEMLRRDREIGDGGL